ncbi:MAG: hypothetical protein ACOX5G_10660 [Kiritimatiellia bacterium]
MCRPSEKTVATVCQGSPRRGVHWIAYSRSGRLSKLSVTPASDMRIISAAKGFTSTP